MASWFTEGTVTVTNGNAVVAGIGTKFSNCRSGDMFVGPDGGIYQIVNPSSDLAVSISPAYRGPTIAGAAYGIVPVNGYPKALADAVNLMVQQWGATLAGLGAVSTENIVPVSKGGTGATKAPDARAILGALAAGDYGLGGSSLTEAGSLSTLNVTKFFNTTAATTGVPIGQGTSDGQGHGIHNQHPNGAYANQMWTALTANRMFFRIRAASNWTAWAELYHTQNTTRAADGTLKAI
ncbi:pyocin knob domain-containing protein [Pseudomonas sp. SDO558_S425]